MSAALEIESVRDLEDLVIDVMYAGLLGGKMHHDDKILHVDWVTGRDVSPMELSQLSQSLQNWYVFQPDPASQTSNSGSDPDGHRCQTSSTLLRALDEQIAHVRKTNQTDQHNRELYNTRRDRAYLAASKDSKKGSKAQGGNYEPPPPLYNDEPMMSGEGRL